MPLVSSGLLVLAVYMALARIDASWDLLGPAILGGAVNVGYTAWKRAASRQILYLGLSVGVLSTLAAALIVFATHSAVAHSRT
jgi:hypothetical protein